MSAIASSFVICMPLASARLSWGHLFGNQAPVELEVGFGKGMFLLSEAAARPQVNFVGLEVAGKYHHHTLQRVEGRRLQNVRLIHGEAGEVISRHVADTSLQAIHIYFPDPWHKKRHKKRRLFGPGFLYHAARTLRRNGALYIATDYAEYFDSIVERVEACGYFGRLLQSPFVERWQASFREGRKTTACGTAPAEQPRLPQSPPPPGGAQAATDLPLTHYERKYRREGRRIYAAHYVVQR
ncbi:MAG: tRNA (guanosine(46)-N7)-methyltransferase TrmB [Candidatus Tectomicrobia bacterium]|nr:tRNA (guanosine(46)-N7)-methyltransferase TrmB [Candidatus Tectomicrobia bacterium]